MYQKTRDPQRTDDVQTISSLSVGSFVILECLNIYLQFFLINFNKFRNSMEQLSVAEGKLGNVMTRLLGVDIFNKKLEMDEER